MKPSVWVSFFIVFSFKSKTRVVYYALPIGFFFSFLIRPVRYVFFRASMTYPIIVGSFFIVRENGILLYARNEWIFMKLKIWLGRIIPLVIIALGEIVLYCNLFKWLTTSFVFIEIVLHILSILIVLNIVRTSRHLSSDLMWIILIMLFPVFGTFVYVLMLLSLLFGKTFRNIIKEQKKASSYYIQDESIIDEIRNDNPDYVSQLAFLHKEGFPFYRNTDFEYYAPCENGLNVMLEELKKAENYIFMEYFIIEEGFMFNSILSILEEKVKQGVEVRIMYDDMGSLGTLPASYAKQLEKKGIKAVSFNRISPIINTIMNHRDHRKILIVDGKVAFSGGANLADEYINKKVKHGHWMDNIICIKGKAVWSYLVMFLTNWNALRHEDFDYSVFKNEDVVDETLFDGYIAPYAETPLDEELTGQSVYEDLLNSANKYVYIMTPYLIIDSEMINTLIHTAKKGVDVRIIMPGIADKQIVHDMGTTYYKQLIQGGVKIYEYEPGFVHSKVFICDDTYATVGTINLDYRSLYLHFENGTLLYKSKKIMDVKQNFMDTLSKCKEIQVEDTHVNIIKGLFLSIIRIFSPLL